MKTLKDLFKEEGGWVDSWQIRHRGDVHPSHETPVVDIRGIRELIDSKITSLEKQIKKGDPMIKKFKIVAKIGVLKELIS